MAHLKPLERSKNLSTCRHFFHFKLFTEQKQHPLILYVHMPRKAKEKDNQPVLPCDFVLAYRLVSSCYRNDLLDVPYFERITLVLKNSVGRWICMLKCGKEWICSEICSPLSQHEFFVFILQEKPEYFQHVLAGRTTLRRCNLQSHCRARFFALLLNTTTKDEVPCPKSGKNMQVHVIWDNGDDLMSVDEHLRSFWSICSHCEME